MYYRRAYQGESCRSRIFKRSKLCPIVVEGDEVLQVLFMAIQQLRHRIFSPPLLEAKHRED